jgi:glycosyltransferase involved in cell wall biosynthesis
MAADTPVVYSSHNVEFKHYEHLSSGLTWPLFAWIRHIERKAVQSADGVVCVSRSDIEQFRETWEFEADLFLVPNAIYESDLAQSPAEEGITVDVPDEIPEGKTTCLFVGSNRPQNVQAARSLVSLASSFRGDIHVVIVGSVGRAISKLPPNVTTTGFVDDLNPYYFHSDVALNPVTAGAGTNIKLLEYFAKQIPVISTRFGIRGYDIDDGYHVTVASPEKMLEAASELTRSVKRRRRQTEAAFEFVRTRTWRNVSSKLRSDLETAFFDHS